MVQINLPLELTELVFFNNNEVYKVYFNAVKLWPEYCLLASTSANSAAIVLEAYNQGLCANLIGIDKIEARNILTIGGTFSYNSEITSFEELAPYLKRIETLDLSGNSLTHSIECGDYPTVKSISVEDSTTEVITPESLEELHLGSPASIEILNGENLNYPSTLSIDSSYNLESISLGDIESANSFKLLADLLATYDHVPTYINLLINLVGAGNQVYITVDSDGDTTCTFLVEGFGEFYKSVGTSLTINIPESYNNSVFKVIALSKRNPTLTSDIIFTVPTLGSIEETSLSYTYIMQSSSATGTETGNKLFDGSTSTKWYCNSLPAYVIFEINPNTIVAGYTMTTANDSTPSRNPRTWTLYGSTDLNTWDVIDSYANKTDLPTTTYTSKSFTLTSPVTGYRYYKLYITAAYSGSGILLSEFKLNTPTTGRVFDLDSIVPSKITIVPFTETMSYRGHMNLSIRANGSQNCIWTIEGNATLSQSSGKTVIVTANNATVGDTITVSAISTLDNTVTDTYSFVLSDLTLYYTYMTMDGSSYFDTEYIPTVNTKIEVTYILTEKPSGNKELVSANAWNESPRFTTYGFITNSSNVQLGNTSGMSSYTVSGYPVLNLEYTLVYLKVGDCTLNGSKLVTLSHTGWTTTNTIKIGGASTEHFIGNMCCVKIYESGVLQHCYRPLVDNVFEDTITYKQLINGGIGNATISSEIWEDE